MKKLKLMIAILAIAFTTNILAGDPHHDDTGSSTTNIMNSYNTIEDRSILASALAQHHFDYGTYAIQKSVAAAFADTDDVAVSAAIAFRDCRDCGLVSMSAAFGNIKTVQNSNKKELIVGVGYAWSH